MVEPIKALPQSFIKSQLDPNNPDQVRDYSENTHYYQTLACLREEKLLRAGEMKLPTQWVQPSVWLKQPVETMETLAKLPPAIAVSTMTYLLSHHPLPGQAQMDWVIRKIVKDYLDHYDQSLMGSPPCSEFALMEAHRRTHKKEWKDEITMELVNRFIEPFRRAVVQEHLVKPAHPFLEEYGAWIAKAAPSLLTSTEVERYEQEVVAKTLALTGREEALHFLTNIIINPDSGFNTRYAVQEGLFEAVKFYPEEIIPFLARILEARINPHLKEFILTRLGWRGDFGIPPDERLIKGVVQTVLDAKGNFAKSENDEAVASWLSRNGSKGADALVFLIQQPVTRENKEFHETALAQAVATDNPSLQFKLFRLLRGGLYGSFYGSVVPGPLQNEIALAYFQSDSDIAHRNFLKVIDSFGGEDVLAQALKDDSLYNYGGGDKWATAYFKRFTRLEENHPDPEVQKRAQSEMLYLAQVYPEKISQKFSQFSPDTQAFLIKTWMDNAPNTGAPTYAHELLADKKTPDSLKRRLQIQIRNIEKANFSQAEIQRIFTKSDHSDYVRKVVLRNLSRDKTQINFLIELAKSDPLDWRWAILKAVAQMPYVGVESILVENCIKGQPPDSELRVAAIAALKARAETPRFRDSALLALQQTLPVSQ